MVALRTQRRLAAMTRKEFSIKSDAIRRIAAWYMLASSAPFFASLIVRVCAPFYLRTHPNVHSLEPAESVLLALAVIGAFWGLAWMPNHFARKWQLACTRCGKLLVDRDGRVALLTARCPKCDNKVFTESIRELGIPARKDWLTKEQFKLAVENLNRKFHRRAFILAVAGLILVLVFAPAGLYLSRLFERGQLDSWLTPTVLRWAGAAMLGTGVILYLGPFVLGVAKKQPGIPCPECGRPIFGGAAQAALERDFCIYCGAQLFAEPSTAKA